MLRSLFVLLLITVSPQLAAAELPIEYFVRAGDYLDVSLSPSGNRLAARVKVDDRVAVVIIDRASGELVGGVRTPTDNEIYRVYWVSDERLVFSYAEERHGIDFAVGTGELYAVDYTGKNVELLAGVRASDERRGTKLRSKKNDQASFRLINVLEDDKKHVLVVEYPWSPDGRVWSYTGEKQPVVSRLNVKTGRKKKLEVLPFPYARPYTTRDGSIRFVTYRNEDALTVSAYRESDDAPWQALDEVFEFVDKETTVVGLNETGDAVFLRSRYGDEGYRTIFRLDFKARTFEPLFTDLDADIVGWLVDPDTGEIAAGKSMRGKTRYHYPETDSKMKTIHRQLAKAFKGRTMDIVSSTRDGSELMVRVTSDVNPGEYYFFNNETKKASFFWANMSWIDPRLLRPMLLDEVVTEDGFTLTVRLTLPEGDGPAPLIVHPHGGPHGVADRWEFNREVQLLANRGFAVLQVNMRGSGDSGERFVSAGYKEWGGKMIDDIAVATRWAMDHPKIDGSRVCAYGASYGAYAAYMLAIREPDLLKCTAGYVGVYDLNIMYTTGDIPKGWGGKSYLERAIGTDPAQLEAFSPTKHADKIKANTMLVHGEADVRAPIEHAYAMRKALKKAGKDVEWIEINQSGHGAFSMRSKMELYEGLLSFLDANLN